MKPLFVPLKTEYYEAFADGSKREELRRYGPRWNEKTCVVGRDVVLSKGYGKKNRLVGRIWKFKRQHGSTFGSTYRAAILAVFGTLDIEIACISIDVTVPHPSTTNKKGNDMSKEPSTAARLERAFEAQRVAVSASATTACGHLAEDGYFLESKEYVAKFGMVPRHWPLYTDAQQVERILHDGVVELILRDVCELEPDDPTMNDTLCVDISVLERILKERISPLYAAPGGAA